MWLRWHIKNENDLFMIFIFAKNKKNTIVKITHIYFKFKLLSTIANTISIRLFVIIYISIVYMVISMTYKVVNDFQLFFYYK